MISVHWEGCKKMIDIISFDVSLNRLHHFDEEVVKTESGQRFAVVCFQSCSFSPSILL